MATWKVLPEHIPVHISTTNTMRVIEILDRRGFVKPPLQITKSHVIYSKIISTKFEGMDAELHVRVFVNGKIEAEYEPPRLRKVISHLFRRSYSAHEYVISLLEENNINYLVDNSVRMLYNTLFPKRFPFVMSEIFFFLHGTLVAPILRWLHASWYRIKRKTRNPPVPLFDALQDGEGSSNVS